jgi:hypothetical protein
LRRLPAAGGGRDPGPGNGIGYNQWLPLSFDGATPLFHSLSQFNLDAAHGTWTIGSGNNYVRNPSFEADRVTQTGVTGWVTSWTGLADASPFNNALGGHTGRWALTLAHAARAMASTMATTTQDIVVPNGSYTLKAWVKSSGGQAVAKVFVHGHGGADIARPLNTAIGQWTEMTIPGILVRNGSIQVGIYSEGRQGQWLLADDFSLVQTAQPGAAPQ